jgi:succinate dehydrogenase/fumarate reductase flavoprotein subunit
MDFTREPKALLGGFENLDKETLDYLTNSDALCALPINRLKRMNPKAIELYKSHNIDLEKEPLRIAVCAQHCNGGIRVDSNWQTNIEGLYAIGEVAGTFGVNRPGGSALNSCQVGGLRVAKHISHKKSNKLPSDFERIANIEVEKLMQIIYNSKSDDTTLIKVRDEYRSYMSKNFAFLRNLSDMKNARIKIEQKLANFSQDNKWSKIKEIPNLFRNYDIICTQTVVASSMCDVAEKYGARGSSFVYAKGGFLERNPISENIQGRKLQTIAQKENGKLTLLDREINQIPNRNLWFESVWKQYNMKNN